MNVTRRAALNKASKNTENQTGILETAYIQIMDCRETQTAGIKTATTKNILSGMSAARSRASQNTKTIRVQFNPATLSFTSGNAGARQEKSSLDKKENGQIEQAQAEETKEKLSVSMKLVFDRSIYMDSSVQPEVESFLALVKNAYVRQVAFYWGTMYYAGIVKGVDAAYTMFNSLGIPSRAVVDLKIDIT